MKTVCRGEKGLKCEKFELNCIISIRVHAEQWKRENNFETSMPGDYLVKSGISRDSDRKSKASGQNNNYMSETKKITRNNENNQYWIK